MTTDELLADPIRSEFLTTWDRMHELVERMEQRGEVLVECRRVLEEFRPALNGRDAGAHDATSEGSGKG